MPYAFAPRAESELGTIKRWDVPLNQWMGLKFEEGAHNTFFNSLSRFTEDQIWDGPDVMQPDLANKVFGVPGYLTFDAPISIQRARLMRERKEEELRRVAYFSAATHSAISGRAALGTVAAIGGGVSNPLDFATMFVPFVGSAKAAGIAKMGGAGLFRQGLERGLITHEALAGATRFPRFGAAVINGTLGNAMTEIPVFMQNVRDQAIYGPQDALLNVALGGVTGGAFHLTGAALKRALQAAGVTHAGLGPDLQDAATHQAVNDLLDGKAISADRVAKLDRDAILRDLQFDEARARSDAMTKIGILPEEARARSIIETLNKRQASAIDLLDMARFKSNTDTGHAGKIAARLIERFEKGDRSADLFSQIADLFELRYNPTAPTLQERLKVENLGSAYDSMRKGAASAFKETRRELHETDVAIRRLMDDLDKSAPAKVPGELQSRLKQLRRNLDATEAANPGRGAKPFANRAYQQTLAAVHGEIRDTAKRLADAEGDLLLRRLSSNLYALQQRRDRLHTDWMDAEALVSGSRQPLTPDEIAAHADDLARKGVVDDADLAARAAELDVRADEIRGQRVQDYIYAEKQRWQAELEGRVSAAEAQAIKAEVAKGKILTDEQVTKLTTATTAPEAAEVLTKEIANLEAELTRPTEGHSELTAIIAKEIAAIKSKADADTGKAYDIASECLIRNLTL